MTTATPDSGLRTQDSRRPFRQAINRIAVWKHARLERYEVCLVREAVACLRGGVKEFDTGIVPDREQPAGDPHLRGLPGSAVQRLIDGHVIEKVKVFADGTWFAKRHKSTRHGRNGAWVDVYQLCSLAAGETFLERHPAVLEALQTTKPAPEPAPVQSEMFKEVAA